MRAYTALSQETLRARDLLKEWASEGFITEAQYRTMEQETVCPLRRTNIFLRIVLFVFTVIVVGAALALVFLVGDVNHQSGGAVLLVFAALSYAAAEFAVSQARFYRHGIEEALAACSVGFLCAGIWGVFFEHSYSATPHGGEFLVPAIGALASLWIWHRFALPYAALAAMIFVIWLPGYGTSSHAAQRMILVAIYALGLAIVMAMRRDHRFTYLNFEYSFAEAILWLGIYAAINLQLLSLDFLGHFRAGPPVAAGVPRAFYWLTWALSWCLPPLVLARGLRHKDRFAIAAGVIAAILTFVTNKPYLGWVRHTWDPMLLGALLIGVALLIRRWLTAAPGEIRNGFTARRLSGKEKSWMNIAFTSLGVAAPSLVVPRPEPASSGFHFGGGDSGGGGASSEF